MIKSKAKKKEVSSINGIQKKRTTINKTLRFKERCKEITRQKLDDLKRG